MGPTELTDLEELHLIEMSCEMTELVRGPGLRSELARRLASSVRVVVLEGIRMDDVLFWHIPARLGPAVEELTVRGSEDTHDAYRYREELHRREEAYSIRYWRDTVCDQWEFPSLRTLSFESNDYTPTEVLPFLRDFHSAPKLSTIRFDSGTIGSVFLMRMMGNALHLLSLPGDDVFSALRTVYTPDPASFYLHTKLPRTAGFYRVLSIYRRALNSLERKLEAKGGKVVRTPYKRVEDIEGGWEDEEWARGDHAGIDSDPEDQRSLPSDELDLTIEELTGSSAEATAEFVVPSDASGDDDELDRRVQALMASFRWQDA